ncbi:translation elongation factor P [Candidatus Mycoplasma haematobovis]|uniref:Translation elongation factor P n=1 Tax=Candidatus Mycoplasma haematobovis TaxID=432608 RepID=A0A1A9QCI2_9MOLU|nr:translation elongation factor P [Candidatus Mycoplasma haematobovis]OAL10177.1 translation elongation factor P [Candidatus Mycoplasma haematobovis]
MAEFIQAIDLRKGQTILWKGDIYLVLDHSFNKTAMRGGIVKCKVKNLKNGSITIEDFSGMKFERALINKLNVTYSYTDSEFTHFMDAETFEDIEVSNEKFKEELKFVEEGIELSLSTYEGEILAINLPEIVSLTIEKFDDDLPATEQKKAITVNGLVVAVPKFCVVGDKIFVSTSDGKYKSR